MIFSVENLKAFLDRNRWVIAIIVTLFLVGCSSGPERLEGIEAISVSSDWYLTELAWSPLDERFAATVDSKQHTGAIYVVDLAGDYKVIGQFDDRGWGEARGASWSPDGELLMLRLPPIRDAYSVDYDNPPFDIVIIEVETGKLVKQVRNGVYAGWGPRPDEIVVMESDAGRMGEEVSIDLINLETGETRSLASANAAYVVVGEGLDISSREYMAYLENPNKIGIVELSTGNLMSTIEADALLSSPRWSPNDGVLAYLQEFSFQKNSVQRWRKGFRLSTADGTCQSNLLDIDVSVISIDWTSDGQRLVFTTHQKGKIFFLDLTEGVGKELHDSFTSCLQ